MQKVIISSEKTNNEFSCEGFYDAEILNLENIENFSLGHMLEKYNVDYKEVGTNEFQKEAFEVDLKDLPSASKIKQAIIASCEAASWVVSEVNIDSFIESYNEGFGATDYQKAVIQQYFSNNV